MHTKTCRTLNSVALFIWLFHKQHLNRCKVLRTHIRSLRTYMKNATVEISLYCKFTFIRDAKALTRGKGSTPKMAGKLVVSQ